MWNSRKLRFLVKSIFFSIQYLQIVNFNHSIKTDGRYDLPIYFFNSSCRSLLPYEYPVNKYNLKKTKDPKCTFKIFRYRIFVPGRSLKKLVTKYQTNPLSRKSTHSDKKYVFATTLVIFPQRFAVMWLFLFFR